SGRWILAILDHPHPATLIEGKEHWLRDERLREDLFDFEIVRDREGLRGLGRGGRRARVGHLGAWGGGGGGPSFVSRDLGGRPALPVGLDARQRVPTAVQGA